MHEDLLEKAFNPNQQRLPKGKPGGGRWGSLVAAVLDDSDAVIERLGGASAARRSRRYDEDIADETDTDDPLARLLDEGDDDDIAAYMRRKDDPGDPAQWVP